MRIRHLIAAAGILAFAAGCNSSSEKSGEQKAAAPATNQEVYEAELTPLNSVVTGLQTTGEAKFVISGDTMTVTIDVKNAPPGIQHWQHFHGFANDSMAMPATIKDDKNGDGIIDVTETGPVSGTTMVPFNNMPDHMNVGDTTYPVANADGSYHYETRIPMDSLKAAFAKAFGGSQLDLDKRVLYIHGVPSSAKLPKTVASIANIPANITLPIAVGMIVKAKQ
ncbi:MAG: hypothetical protein J0H55_06940 [Chitinophagaceae bacterium]|nr:hypothetical protein [Chitinophagaceae bacterium]